MKKAILLLYVALILGGHAHSQDSWQLQQSGTINDLRSVYFPSKDTGYIVGMYGTILNTINGGETWNITQTQSGSHLFSVFFTSNMKGFAVGAYGTLLKTTDGGQNWIEQKIDYWHLVIVCFPDSMNGYIMCALGRILKTVDGGLTWTQIPLVTQKILECIYFSDANTGYEVGEGGRIYKTINGGATWDSLSSGTTNFLTSVFFPSESIGYVTGYNGTILKTTDSGNSWTALTIGTTNDLYNLYLPSITSGCILDGSNIYKTIDGGESWTIDFTCSANLESVFFTDINTGYVAGLVGNIRKTTTFTGISAFKDNKYSFYPNPCDNFLVIRNQDIHLLNIEIFDLYGHEVYSQKTMNTSIDVRDYSSGIYFLKIEERVYKIIKN